MKSGNRARSLVMFAAVLFLSLFLAAIARAGDAERIPPWEFATETKGIKIWTRHIPGNPMKDFRVEMVSDAPMTAVIAAIADVNQAPKWFWMMDQARVLDGSTLENAHFYYSLYPIWPIKARDAVLQFTVRQVPQTLEVDIDMHAEPDHIPRVPEHVRMPSMNSAFRLMPLSKTQTRIEMIGNGDPGGAIPLWLANSVVTILPKESFKNLREHLADPRYRDTESLYAANPMLRDLLSRIRLP